MGASTRSRWSFSNERLQGLGVHDVVYVATENDSIYAIDSESGAILGMRNLGVSIPNTAKDYDDNIYPRLRNREHARHRSTITRSIWWSGT